MGRDPEHERRIVKVGDVIELVDTVNEGTPSEFPKGSTGVVKGINYNDKGEILTVAASVNDREDDGFFIRNLKVIEKNDISKSKVKEELKKLKQEL